MSDGFFEWKKLDAKTKQPYHIHLQGHRPFVFAGLWERWSKDPAQGPVESFTIITTTPNPKVATLHDRMPVILPAAARDLWLDPAQKDVRQLAALLCPYPEDEIEFTAVSRMVNSPANNSPQCIVPVHF